MDYGVEGKPNIFMERAFLWKFFELTSFFKAGPHADGVEAKSVHVLKNTKRIG